MKVLVTGASGWIGSASVEELVRAGHEVTGLARSEESATAITALGARPVRGTIDDPDALATLAVDADAVVHLAYNHDFSQMPAAAATDRAVIAAFGASLRPGAVLLMAAGTLGLAAGRAGTEDDRPDPASHPRSRNGELALALADNGLRPVVARFAPTVHGAGDHGFTARLVEVAHEQGFSAYIGDGENRWPAVHRSDAGALVRLAVENPVLPVVHAVAEEGVPARRIAQAIGDGLGLPVRSIAPEQADEHFGWIGGFFAADAPASSELTREALGWTPSGPTLVEDLQAGAYF